MNILVLTAKSSNEDKNYISDLKNELHDFLINNGSKDVYSVISFSSSFELTYKFKINGGKDNLFLTQYKMQMDASTRRKIIEKLVIEYKIDSLLLDKRVLIDSYEPAFLNINIDSIASIVNSVLIFGNGNFEFLKNTQPLDKVSLCAIPSHKRGNKNIPMSTKWLVANSCLSTLLNNNDIEHKLQNNENNQKNKVNVLC